LHPSFDDASSSSPGWWYLQSHEILLNKGREILRLSMKCTKLENIYNYSTHKQQHQRLIEGVQEERKKSRGRTQFSTKFGTKLRFISYPFEAQFYFFFPLFFKNLIPYVTKRGVSVPSFPNFSMLDKVLEP
jgi:hypothetical protein